MSSHMTADLKRKVRALQPNRLLAVRCLLSSTRPLNSYEVTCHYIRIRELQIDYLRRIQFGQHSRLRLHTKRNNSLEIYNMFNGSFFTCAGQKAHFPENVCFITV
jgi:hypothetical protein